MGGLAPAASTGSDVLFRRWFEHRDMRDRDLLIERFLPLARRLAMRYASPKESYDDLVQVASLGLVKAVERFDPTRGFAFTSFAVPTIVGELKRYFRDSAWALHVDRSAQELARRIGEATRELTSSLGRSPTVQELAAHLDCSEERVLEGLQTAEAYDTVSLDAPRGTSADEEDRFEILGDEDVRLDRIPEGATIFAAAQNLPERERRILYLRFGEDLTQAEIADQIGVSQMQVSRLLRKSVARLRELTSDAAV